MLYDTLSYSEQAQLISLQTAISSWSCAQIQAQHQNNCRPWDACASNFVFISSSMGMHAEYILQILQQYRYDCNLEMVEQTMAAAGIMAWSPS